MFPLKVFFIVKVDYQKIPNVISIYEKSHFTSKAGKVKQLSTYEGTDFIDKWSQKWVICIEEAIPKRGDSEKKSKIYNGNEIYWISIKF